MASSLLTRGVDVTTTVADVMTRGVRTMAPDDSMALAAQAMEELNIGSLPVMEDGEVVGIVTDRDLVVRGVAQGLPADRTPLRDLMTEAVQVCYEDETVDEVLEQMQATQIRRLPVLDRDMQVVGILSLGDVAAKADEVDVGEALADISEPAEPDRSSLSAASGPAGGGAGGPRRDPLGA